MTEVMTKFETGATRSADNGDKLHYRRFFSTLVAKARAQYMQSHRLQADGALREPDNWKAGMPRARYADSLARHEQELNELLEVLGTEGDHEDALVEKLCAIMFNAEGFLHEILVGRSIK